MPIARVKKALEAPTSLGPKTTRNSVSGATSATRHNPPAGTASSPRATPS